MNLTFNGNFVMANFILCFKCFVITTFEISNSTIPAFTSHIQSKILPLPLPIRISKGFWVIGRCGKNRTQSLPIPFNALAKIFLAALIWEKRKIPF